MNPKNVYETFHKLYTDLTDAEHVAAMSEIAKKATKAKLAIQFKDAGCGIAEAELRAEADYEYIKVCEAWAQAKTEAAAAKGVLESRRYQFEAQRTLEANERAATKYMV